MDRTVKTKITRSLNKGESVVLLPGQTGAEPWEVWIIGSGLEPRCVQTCATPLDNRMRKGATLALPVTEIFCLPLWLNETDSKQMAGMIPLQLELRGLQSRGTGPVVFDWTIVAQEGMRTLVMVGVLPPIMAAEVQTEAYDAFELSARYLAFSENSMTIWRQQDELLVSITRGADLVYCQALSEGYITPRVIQDINCVKAALTMQEILLPLQQVALWVSVSPAERELLETTFQLPVRQMECPAPKAPSPVWNLVPTVIGEARRNRETKRWIRRGLCAALALYFLVVVGMAARFLVTTINADALHRWQSANSDTIDMIRQTRAAWKELGPSVDKNHYPLELLLHVSEAIPADQLRMTLFETSDTHILIKGEAKNAAAAFQFLDKLKSDSHFAGYTWNMGQPHLLPNDLAQLQIEGTLATAN